ncbi:STAS domain-containing protein [Deinococcus sp. KSM4-11]|uniref:STAS domain-containing protein n=1 Tax=Deinococcus sp. KSM4-11 TaxID=2568654 RepID=UPI0010A330FB|nr:STAS domain-containing protein [Deinococcus sp. KSM4-11]THF87112.1 STAS domain-containing protein [Deinococcus sp. KSM4-11]
MTNTPPISEAVAQHPDAFLQDWLATQLRAPSMRRDLISDATLRQQSDTFLTLFTAAVSNNGRDIQSPAWATLRGFLETLSAERVLQGFSSAEVATFVFSFKQPLFDRLRVLLSGQPDALADATWAASELIDQLGLYAVEVYQQAREGVIERQRQDMLELSTPVVKVWAGVVALPLIGTLDSERTQVVMETLLERIVETGSTVAIIDITGVPTVDTLVAQHLLRTVAAARLMGAECIISGIRPQIAQTIVHLGIDLEGVTTKASLADAIQVALARGGYRITATEPA